MCQVQNEVLDDPHIVQRVDRSVFARLGHEPRARKPFVPSMFMAQEPQTPSRQERRKVSVESTLFLIQIKTSRTIKPQSSRSTSNNPDTWVVPESDRSDDLERVSPA
jgi:hypothetical protein